MKLIPAVLIGLVALAPRAEADTLRIYSDAALTQSSIDDSAPQIVSLYVVHSGPVGATGVRFSTERYPDDPTPGFTGVWLSDASSFVTVGASPTDISIAYGVCDLEPLLILTMSYQMFGTSAACSGLRIAPPDGFPFVLGADVHCAFAEGSIQNLGSLRVNCPVSTESTTWGRVKALYRD